MRKYTCLHVVGLFDGKVRIYPCCGGVVFELGKLHSKIIISDLVDFFFSEEFDGENPRSKFEQEYGQTDVQKWSKNLR